MLLSRPAAGEPERTVLMKNGAAYVNVWTPLHMPWKGTRVKSVLVLIIIMIMYSTSLAGIDKAMLSMVMTAVLTATAEELVRAAARLF
jgi:hypothetical protein